MPPALLDPIVLNTSGAADSQPSYPSSIPLYLMALNSTSNPTRHPPPILSPPARNASFEPSIPGPSRGSLIGMRKRRTRRVYGKD